MQIFGWTIFLSPEELKRGLDLYEDNKTIHSMLRYEITYQKLTHQNDAF